MANNRVYYAIQQLALKEDGQTGGGAWTAVHGGQSVAVSTTFNLVQAFQIGMLGIYENIEGIPDVEVTASKLLDGYPLMWTLSTQDASTPTLVGRSSSKCLIALGIWDESLQAAGEGSANPIQQVEMSGMFPSNVTMNFPLDDNFTEDITFAGNDKVWLDVNTPSQGINGCSNIPWTTTLAAGAFDGNNDAPVGSGGVNRRENMIFASSAAEATGGGRHDYTVLPVDIPGVGSNGEKTTSAHIQSITVSVDFAREDQFEMGTKRPFAKTVTFPVEVTCDIEVGTTGGDLVDALSDGCGDGTVCSAADNLSDRTIRIATCEGTRVYLGDNNKLSNVSMGGGDAGGGNVTVTYSYTTYNDFTVMHSGDPNTNFTWASRTGYLVG